MEIKNALIDWTQLGYEDHGILTFCLYLDYGDGGHQGAGGYALDSYDKAKKKRVSHAVAMECVAEILRVVGVDSWEKLKGKHVRVKADWNRVYAIGNLLKDRWLNFEEFFKVFADENK